MIETRIEVSHSTKMSKDNCVPRAKKRQKTSNDHDGDGNDDEKKPLAVTVNYDALSSVMSFLGPRELLCLSLTCKTMRDTVTTSIVVKSAMIHGGHAKKTIQELLPLMKNGSIFVPSPNRLLRLVNGKYCEVCYTKKTNFVRPGYGVFFCWECLTNKYTKQWKTGWARYRKDSKYKDALFDSRVAPQGSYGSATPVKYLMTNHYLEGEEKVGPIVRFDDIDAMVSNSDGIEDYFQTVLEAPEESEYQEFIDAYDECEGRAKKEEKARQQKREQSTAQSRGRKLEKARQIRDDLTKLLDERWRSEAMSSYETTPSKWNGAIAFHIKFVNILLKPYIIAPSKMKKTILSEIAEEINTKFEKVVSSFLSYDFLSEDNPFQSKLKAYVSQDLSTVKLLCDPEKFGYKFGRNCDFFNLVWEDKLNKALAEIYSEDFAFVLLPPDQQKEYVKDSFDTRKELYHTSILARFAFVVVEFKLSEQEESSEGKEVSIPNDCEDLVGLWSTNFEAIEETFDKLQAGFCGYKEWLDTSCKGKKKSLRWQILVSHIRYNFLDKSCIRSLIQSDFERVDEHLLGIQKDREERGL